ncbi:pyruvate formate lyase activating enzyme [Parelusimicrobium proximum]|uniref:anaerobic ribonucleoside-triphosphate reductase activating protein n=1 Tax=Parelusimicrobium proximum TaxID=3228953 RepID=UPI003D16AC2C
MKIGGLLKFSLIDYPGKMSAIVFTQGCNMRCAYCHNPELVYPHLLFEPFPEEDVLQFLDKRKGNLDGVVISGGEPTLQPDLLDFMAKVKAMGYKVKLDTNGTKPEVIEKALEAGLVDLIAMDIKAPYSKYEKVCGTAVDMEAVSRSMALIIGSGIDYEFRTTYDKSLLNDTDIDTIRTYVPEGGTFTLQECKPVEAEKDVLKVQK